MNGRGSRIVVGVVGITRRALGLLIVLATIVMAPISDTLAQAGAPRSSRTPCRAGDRRTR